MLTSYPVLAPISFGLALRRKTPLFASSSTQNSARTWKSVYEFFDTRKPCFLSPLSAITAPSAILQFALPIAFQLSRLDPSNSTVHPEPEDMDEQAPSASAASPMTSRDSLFIGELLLWFAFDAAGSSLHILHRFAAVSMARSFHSD